jgi:adenylate kinase family enzyme
MNNDAHLKRILVVGASGSGKTTLAQQLALRLDVPHVELDALFWEANWTSVSPEIFRERVTQALAGDRWVTDGNFSQVSDLTWGRADTVIWLDYGVGTILMRLLPRTFRRIFTRQALWNGNRESLLWDFLIAVLGFINVLLPPLEHICGVGIEYQVASRKRKMVDYQQ